MANLSAEHALTEVDEATRLAVCAACGPVKVFRSGAGWRCSVAHATYKRLRRAEVKAARLATTALRTETICCGVPFEIPPIDPKMTLGTGVIHAEAVVGCGKCGKVYGIMRRSYLSDRRDDVTWVVADEVYSNGTRKHITMARDFGGSRIVAHGDE